MSYQPKPGVPDEVRKYMSQQGRVGGRRGDPKAKARGARNRTKKQRRFAAAMSNHKQHGTPIPAEFETMIHGAPAK